MSADDRSGHRGDNVVVGRQTSTVHPRPSGGVGEGTQFDFLQVNGTTGAPVPEVSRSPCNFGLDWPSNRRLRAETDERRETVRVELFA